VKIPLSHFFPEYTYYVDTIVAFWKEFYLKEKMEMDFEFSN